MKKYSKIILNEKKIEKHLKKQIKDLKDTWPKKSRSLEDIWLEWT